MKSKLKLFLGAIFMVAGIQAAMAAPYQCFKCSDASGTWKCEKIKCPSSEPPPH